MALPIDIDDGARRKSGLIDNAGGTESTAVCDVAGIGAVGELFWCLEGINAACVSKGAVACDGTGGIEATM